MVFLWTELPSASVLSRCLLKWQTVDGGVPVERVAGEGMLGWSVVDRELLFYEREEEMELEAELVLADDQI